MVVNVALVAIGLAVVVAFAMIGYITDQLIVIRNQLGSAESIGSAKLGFRPGRWLAPLSDETERLIVLSTTCESCTQVAGRLPAIERVVGVNGAAIVVGPSASEIDVFIATHRLARGELAVAADPAGRWVGSELGLSVSPAFVTFDDGVLSSAIGFSTIEALEREMARG